MEGAGAAPIGGRRVIASISGGKDSAAMSLYLQELGVEHERVFMDTGWEHPATYEYLRGPLTKALGPITEIRAMVPPEASGVAGATINTLADPSFVPLDFHGLVRRKGMFPSRIARFCTEELKVKPARAFLGHLLDQGHDVVNAVGIRRAESQARAKMGEWEWSSAMDCYVWRPIASWTVDDVRAIHTRHGLTLNPLYAMGATRVGCWPCIHARKSEIALVARVDPLRIDQIRALEADLNARGQERDAQMGRAPILRSMFWWHGSKGSNTPIPIDDAVTWSNSKRGEWQPAGAGDGCARHGFCQVDEDAA